MAISQLPQAPYRQDRKTFPTALSTDVIFSEIRDCNIVDFPAYGTLHPNTKKWPDHKLVFIKPVDIERNEIFEFFYAADRSNQDLYNFAFGYRNIIGNVGGREFRNVQRVYVTARESFSPYDIPFGTAMPNVPEDKFEGVNYVFFDRQQQKIDIQELDSLYVVEVHTYVETAFLDYKLAYSSQKDDGLPEKFKVAIPQQQTEEMVEGLAEMPVLVSGELSVSEDQLNPDVKLVKRLTRNVETTPVLSGKVVTNVLQVADVEESIVDDGTAITVSELTVDGSVESLGNGKSVQKIITAPELFTAQSFSIQRPDAVPEKFRVAIPTTTTEESVAGIAEQPTLVTGELAASEQQVNVFVKRKQKTKRNVVDSTVLTEKATDNTKQLATVTETYQTGDTIEAPSATVDITSNALGDGTYIVTRVEVPELFTASTLSTEKPEYIPTKFQATIPATTIETNVIGTATQPSLATNDIAASEQQVNKFVKRTQRKTRDIPSNVTLAGSEFSQATLFTTAEELVDAGTTVNSGPLVVESVVTPIGGGKAVRTSKSVTTGAYSSSNPATRRIENRVTPLETDIIFIETGVMPTTSLAYGTPHYDSAQWPNHKLVLIKPAGRDGVLYEFYYAADRENQDDYNLVDQNGQYLTRSYIILRSDYYNRATYAATIPTVGVSPDPVFGSTDPIYGDFVFSGESVKHTGTELDSLYIEVERTYQLREEVTYEFNETLEKTFKVTKRVVARNSAPELPAVGKIVNRQNVNAWHDIEMITELEDRESYFDGDGRFIPIELPDVPKDVQYNFPNLLNWVDIKFEYKFKESGVDVAILNDFDMTSPPAGPFAARVKRVITDDPDSLRAQYPVLNLHPKREIIGVTYRDDYTRGIDISRLRWEYGSVGASQFEVPASIHGEIDITLNGNDSSDYSIDFAGEIDSSDPRTAKLRMKTTDTLAATADYYTLVSGGEIIAGYDVQKVALNLYLVSVIFINIDGLYSNTTPVYSGLTRQQTSMLTSLMPLKATWSYTASGGNILAKFQIVNSPFLLVTPYGNVSYTPLTTEQSAYFADNGNWYPSKITAYLNTFIADARRRNAAAFVSMLRQSQLSQFYTFSINPTSISLKSLALMTAVDTSIQMSITSINTSATIYKDGEYLPYGGGPTVTSTSTLIPA
jgi:hypothetical protein